MVSSKVFTDIITKEGLNLHYANSIQIDNTDKFNIPDKIINSLILIVKECQDSPAFENEKNIVRQFVAEKLFEQLDIHAPDKDSAMYLKFSQKIDAFLFCYKLFLNISESDFENSQMYNRILRCKDRARIRQDFSYLPDVIVSLTSFPGRIDKVYKALNSVFTQSFTPDKVILWLAEEQFPEREAQLPESIMEYTNLGLEIRWCPEDLKPHKKYYYVMQEFPQALIITVDDDLIYDGQMIEVLVTSYLHFPGAVSATRTHLMQLDEQGRIAPYSSWLKEFSGILGQPSMQLFSTSGAGTLYPPDSMDKELFNIENIRRLSPNADDLWFKVMQLKKGTPVVLAKRNEKLVYVPESQKIALYHVNERLNENDVQLNNILNVYDPDNLLIDMIFADGYTADSKVIGIDIYENNDFGTLDSAGKYMRKNLKIESKLSEVQAKYNDLNAKNKKLNEQHKKKTDDFNKLKEKTVELEKKLKILKEKQSKTSKELSDIRNSLSFRIGRGITFIPRKIRGGIHCYKENGLIYTVKRVFEKIRK